MGYSINKIEKLLKNIEKYKLDVSLSFLGIPIEKMSEIYNGCGPDWMSDKYRAILTWAFDRFEETFLIHDVDFHYSDKTKKGFDKANKRMLTNMYKKIKGELSWWNPNRYFQMGRARLAYRAVDICGWTAWLD